MKALDKEINNFLKANDLHVSIFQYSDSLYEPVTTESMTNILSDEGRRLTESHESYQLYNGSGQYYLESGDFFDAYNKISGMQENGLTKPNPDNLDDLYEAIDLIDILGQKGISVYGTNHSNYDSWKVLDDQSLKIALYKERDTGDKQLDMVSDQDGKIYLIDKNENQVLVRRDVVVPKGTCPTDVYDIRFHQQLALRDVPRSKLGIVLLAIFRGFSFGQIEKTFLWPKLSKDLLSDAKLIFKRDFYSDSLEIKELADFDKLEELPVYRDNDHITSNYQYYSGEANKRLGFAFPDSQLIDVFDYLYHNHATDSEKETQEFSDFIVSIADEFDILILRSERRLNCISDLTDLTPDEDDGFGISADRRDNSHDDMLETVFTLKSKNSDDFLEENMTLDKMVSYFWIRARSKWAKRE